MTFNWTLVIYHNKRLESMIELIGICFLAALAAGVHWG
jgi:hypothetical protein